MADTDPQYAKATISLKDTITSTPKQRQTYKKNVNDYNTKVRAYYTEKDRVEAENKRRQEEYQKNLAKYEAQKARAREKQTEIIQVPISEDNKQTTTGKPTNYNIVSDINIFVNKKSSPEKPNFEFTPILQNTTYLQNQSQERYKFTPLLSNINKPTKPEVLPTPEKPKFDFQPLLESKAFSQNLKSGDSNRTPIFQVRPLTSTEKTFSNQIATQRQSKYEPKKTTYFGEIKKEVKSRYIDTYIKPISRGIKTTVQDPREAGRILKTESLPSLKRGASIFANLQTNSYNRLVDRQKNLSNQDRLRILKSTVLIPGKIQDKTYINVQDKPDFSPTNLAKATVLIGETALVMEAPRIATGIKNLGLRATGKYVPEEVLYSEVARTSASGIDTTFNPNKTIKYFKESQRNVKGTALEGLYSEDYVIGSSSTGNKFSTNKVLSKSELGQPMNETGGTFISPIKAGQPRFLRLQGEQSGSELSLNPLEIFSNKSNPTTYVTGIREVKQLPKNLINKKPTVFEDIEAFQRSRVGRAEAYITRESSLGIKKEPEAVLNVGQTFKEPILKQPLYTKIKGQTVRVRPIYLDENPNLIRSTSKIKNNSLIDDLPLNNITKQFSNKNKLVTIADKYGYTEEGFKLTPKYDRIKINEFKSNILADREFEQNTAKLKDLFSSKLNKNPIKYSEPIFLGEEANIISKTKNSLKDLEYIPKNTNVKGIKTKNLTSLDRQKISGDYYYDLGTKKVPLPYNLFYRSSSKSSSSVIELKNSNIPFYSSKKISSTESPNKYISVKYPSLRSITPTYKISTPSHTNEPSISKTYIGIKPEGYPSDTEKSSSLISPSYSSYYTQLDYPSFSGSYPGLVTSTSKRTLKPLAKRRTEQSRTSEDKDLSYRIQIKSKGKWVSVKDKTKRDYGSAFNKGASIVDSYAERSFRLKPYKAKPTSREPVSPISNKFYQPAKSPTLRSAFVEKTAFLIDTPGEVRGISYKGQQAQKNKRNKKNMRGFNIW